MMIASMGSSVHSTTYQTCRGFHATERSIVVNFTGVLIKYNLQFFNATYDPTNKSMSYYK